MPYQKNHKEKTHQHRALIGFDGHGVPKVLVPADTEAHVHMDENGNPYQHFHEAEFTADYMNAVAEYKKTFPSKQDVLDNTPDPAVRQMMLHMEQIGADTAFDRFDQQKPMCSYGLSGLCCKICNMGPCRITPKSPKGVCGADADLIVARNLLRSAAAGVAQHGMHAREVILSLKWAAQGKLDLPIIGVYKVKAMAEAFGIKTKNRNVNKIAIDLADVCWRIFPGLIQGNTVQSKPVPPRSGRRYGRSWISFPSALTMRCLRLTIKRAAGQMATGGALCSSFCGVGWHLPLLGWWLPILPQTACLA